MLVIEVTFRGVVMAGAIKVAQTITTTTLITFTIMLTKINFSQRGNRGGGGGSWRGHRGGSNGRGTNHSENAGNHLNFLLLQLMSKLGKYHQRTLRKAQLIIVQMLSNQVC